MKKANNTVRPFAVFDADGTIFRLSLLIELVKRLIMKRIFPEEALWEFEKEEKAYFNRTGTYHAYVMAVVGSFIKHIQGKERKKIIEVSEEVVDIYKDYTYVYTRQLVERLKGEGYCLVMISMSPKIIVDIFAKYLGFEKSYGIMYDVDKEDKFTGGIMHRDQIMDKGKIIDRILNDEKLNVKLEGSYAVGDTEGDIKMFERVDHVIAFNPNQNLIDYIDSNKKHNWKTVVERKDVVYHNPK